MTAVLETLDATLDISRFIAHVQQMREGDDEDVGGWLIRRPALVEVDEHFGILYAKSKAGSSEPLTLPQGLEVSIGIISGAIQIDGFCGEFTAGHFFVVRPQDGRTVRSVHPSTQLMCMFFRETRDDGPAVAARPAA